MGAVLAPFCVGAKIGKRGYHVYPHGAGFRLSCGRRRPVQPEGSAWKLSITLETEFCLEAVEEALARYGKPEIFNTDQGSSSPASPSPACCSRMRSRSHGWERRLARQHLRRAPWRDHQIRGGCTYGPTRVSLRHGPPSADISTAFTMPEGPIRALIGGRRMRPTSLRCSQCGCRHDRERNSLAAANRLFKQAEPALNSEQ